MPRRQTLMDAFGVTEADLTANRQGTLTEEQHQRILAATLSDATFMAGFAIFIAVVMYGVLYMIIDSGKVFDFEKGISLADIVILFAAGGLPTAGILWGVYTIFIHRRARNARRVEVAEGLAEPQVRRYKKVVLHQVIVDGRTFDVSPQALEWIESGRSYRIYFEPLSKVVVAVEPMEQ